MLYLFKYKRYHAMWAPLCMVFEAEWLEEGSSKEEEELAIPAKIREGNIHKPIWETL